MKTYSTFLKILFALLTSLFTSNATHAMDRKYPKWTIDSDISYSFSIKDQFLIFNIKNEGRDSRNISSTIIDQNFIKSMMLHASFINFESPRRTTDEFRLFSDGVAGSTSEIFKVSKVSIAPNETIEVKINVMDSMNNVANKLLEKYLSTDGSQFMLHMTVSMRDMGIEDDCSLRYIFPLMAINIKDGKPTICSGVGPK